MTYAYESLPCNDCKRDIGYKELDEYAYILHHKLWKSLVPENGYMCIECLEKRLKRPLNMNDFNWDVPLNHSKHDSELLGRRKNNL